MSGQWSVRQGDTVEDVPPASVLRHLETVSTVSGFPDLESHEEQANVFSLWC